MIKTRVCEVLGIEHPIALGGLGGGFTQPAMVAAVSNAGGFGAIGLHGVAAPQVREAAAEIRATTNKPYALNYLLFKVDEEAFQAGLDDKPAGIALAWPEGHQDVKPYVDRAHDAGCKVTLMAGGVAEAERGAEAGADVIVAQGTEGGGHVSWMASMVLTPMVVDAVAPVPVLAAGGFVDGRGLAAALALGAGGILLGTRFLACTESQLHPNFKQAILDSDGHDSVLTEIPDIAQATVWPGAMSRAKRNAFIERWMGREWALRQNQAAALAGVMQARKAGDVEEAPLSFGQDAGLIIEIIPAGEIIRQIATEAEEIVARTLPALIA